MDGKHIRSLVRSTISSSSSSQFRLKTAHFYIFVIPLAEQLSIALMFP